MDLNDEQFDQLIKERITMELEQIPVPPIDEEWLKFKKLVNSKPRKRSGFLAIAAILTGIIITGSLMAFNPGRANALGISFMEIFNHIVGKTTQNETETIPNNVPESKKLIVQNLGGDIEKETTLEDAKKLVYFKIAEPEYLPNGTSSPKVFIMHISEDVYKIRMVYNYQGKSIVIIQQNTFGTTSQGLLYDTDDTNTQKIEIDGSPGTMLTDKSGVNVLTWHTRGLLLELTGQLPKDEFMKIAQSIS